MSVGVAKKAPTRNGPISLNARSMCRFAGTPSVTRKGHDWRFRSERPLFSGAHAAVGNPTRGSGGTSSSTPAALTAVSVGVRRVPATARFCADAKTSSIPCRVCSPRKCVRTRGRARPPWSIAIVSDNYRVCMLWRGVARVARPPQRQANWGPPTDARMGIMWANVDFGSCCASYLHVVTEAQRPGARKPIYLRVSVGRDCGKRSKKRKVVVDQAT